MLPLDGTPSAVLAIDLPASSDQPSLKVAKPGLQAFKNIGHFFKERKLEVVILCFKNPKLKCNAYHFYLVVPVKSSKI